MFHKFYCFNDIKISICTLSNKKYCNLTFLVYQMHIIVRESCMCRVTTNK